MADKTKVEETPSRRMKRKVEFVDKFMRANKVSSRRANDEFERRERAKSSGSAPSRKTSEQRGKSTAKKKPAKRPSKLKAAAKAATKLTALGGPAAPGLSQSISSRLGFGKKKAKATPKPRLASRPPVKKAPVSRRRKKKR